MDIVAHGLWAGAAGKAANFKLRNEVRFFHAAFWGMFPDLAAFVPMAVMLIRHGFFGQPISMRLLFSHTLSQVLPESLRPEVLYQYSHSLLVFLVVFGVVWLLYRRPVLAMLGWPLHILMDIPTHGGGVYRTPFLWPLSSYRFSGIWWSREWFMILNYSLIAAVYAAVFLWPLVSRRGSKATENAECGDGVAHGQRRPDAAWQSRSGENQD